MSTSKREYFEKRAAAVREHGEFSPQVELLDKQQLSAINLRNIGLVDASVQSAQGGGTARVGEWDADRRERAANRKLLQEKADNLEAQGRAMAQYKHFYGSEE